MSEDTILCIVAYWFMATVIATIAAVYGAYPRGRDVTWGQLSLLIVLLPGYCTIGVCILFIAVLVTVWDYLDKPVRRR